MIIKELKEEIIELQNIIKQPDYLSLYKPDEKTMIACYKEYLDLTREEFLKNTVYELNINLDYTITNKQKNLILNRMFLAIKELPINTKIDTSIHLNEDLGMPFNIDFLIVSY